MSPELDYYDAERMMRDAEDHARWYTDQAIRDACREIRGELAHTAELLGERIEGLARVLASRTDHLA